MSRIVVFVCLVALGFGAGCSTSSESNLGVAPHQVAASNSGDLNLVHSDQGVKNMGAKSSEAAAKEFVAALNSQRWTEASQIVLPSHRIRIALENLSSTTYFIIRAESAFEPESDPKVDRARLDALLRKFKIPLRFEYELLTYEDYVRYTSPPCDHEKTRLIETFLSGVDPGEFLSAVFRLSTPFRKQTTTNQVQKFGRIMSYDYLLSMRENDKELMEIAEGEHFVIAPLFTEFRTIHIQDSWYLKTFDI